MEIKICDLVTGRALPSNTEGELYVKSAYSMLGYYKKPIATNITMVDNWIRTGDIALIDEGEYLSIKGRLKDVIIRGGENISPIDMESHLIKHLEIENAIIVGIPDEILGEEIFAFIKITKASTLTKNDILEFLSGKMSKHKFPKHIEFIDSFPLISTGKIKRTTLREIAIRKINPTILAEVAVN